MLWGCVRVRVRKIDRGRRRRGDKKGEEYKEVKEKDGERLCVSAASLTK